MLNVHSATAAATSTAAAIVQQSTQQQSVRISPNDELIEAARANPSSRSTKQVVLLKSFIENIPEFNMTHEKSVQNMRLESCLPHFIYANCPPNSFIYHSYEPCDSIVIVLSGESQLITRKTTAELTQQYPLLASSGKVKLNTSNLAPFEQEIQRSVRAQPSAQKCQNQSYYFHANHPSVCLFRYASHLQNGEATGVEEDEETGLRKYSLMSETECHYLRIPMTSYRSIFKEELSKKEQLKTLIQKYVMPCEYLHLMNVLSFFSKKIRLEKKNSFIYKQGDKNMRSLFLVIDGSFELKSFIQKQPLYHQSSTHKTPTTQAAKSSLLRSSKGEPQIGGANFLEVKLFQLGVGEIFGHEETEAEWSSISVMSLESRSSVLSIQFDVIKREKNFFDEIKRQGENRMQRISSRIKELSSQTGSTRPQDTAEISNDHPFNPKDRSPSIKKPPITTDFETHKLSSNSKTTNPQDDPALLLSSSSQLSSSSPPPRSNSPTRTTKSIELKVEKLLLENSARRQELGLTNPSQYFFGRFSSFEQMQQTLQERAQLLKQARPHKGIHYEEQKRFEEKQQQQQQQQTQESQMNSANIPMNNHQNHPTTSPSRNNSNLISIQKIIKKLMNEGNSVYLSKELSHRKPSELKTGFDFQKRRQSTGAGTPGGGSGKTKNLSFLQAGLFSKYRSKEDMHASKGSPSTSPKRKQPYDHMAWLSEFDRTQSDTARTNNIQQSPRFSDTPNSSRSSHFTPRGASSISNRSHMLPLALQTQSKFPVKLLDQSVSIVFDQTLRTNSLSDNRSKNPRAGGATTSNQRHVTYAQQNNIQFDKIPWKPQSPFENNRKQQQLLPLQNTPNPEINTTTNNGNRWINNPSFDQQSSAGFAKLSNTFKICESRMAHRYLNTPLTLNLEPNYLFDSPSTNIPSDITHPQRTSQPNTSLHKQ